jgi:hypothetical protein
MELLGEQLGMNHDDCDNLFIVGMFSLLDVLFDMPMNAFWNICNCRFASSKPWPNTKAGWACCCN